MNPNLRYYDAAQIKAENRTLETDVCIYGGTSAGVIAAVQLSKMGKRAVLLEPSAHLGGLSSGGLGNTDIGNKAAIGGLSREFYRRVGQKYGVAEEWRFEPRIAEQVFHEMLDETETPVFTRQFLQSVEKEGGKLTALTTESGLTVRAEMFIDATYEGDLLDKAGVSFHTGREDNSVYNETLNGAQVRESHQFHFAVDPYLVEGDASSGLLPGINAVGPRENGEGDHRIQAYNFRLCLSNRAENRLPFLKPEGYDERHYVLLARYLAKGWDDVFDKFDPIRGDKVDMNNHGAVSTDFIGMNHDYPTADYATRERIFQDHVRYQQGLMWFLANDPQVPEPIRARMNEWGLPRDEFTQTGGWPHQLYVREARRMVSDYVMTEADCRGHRKAEDAIGLAAYTMDSHNCQRFVRDGRVWNEGDVQVSGFKPYPISYRSLVPHKTECENLLVAVCVATSHIAYGSLRMEPVFMILGQSAATAAAIAMDENIAVQDVDYSMLRAKLQKDGQILQWA